MSGDDNRQRDLAGRWSSFLLVWGLPVVAMTTAMALATPARALVWVAALAWMGGACLVNARKCQRIHCRYTGPWFLAMIVPVGLIGLGVMSIADSGWWMLGVVIVGGAKVIWWASERAWGTYGKRAR